VIDGLVLEGQNSMLIRLSVFGLIALLGAQTLFAQQRRPTISPEVGSEGKVTFRVSAAEAKQVQLAGQWPGGNTDMQKNVDGIWEVTADKVPAGVWEYSIKVDGVSMIDPANSAIKPMRSPRTSILHIPSNPPAIHDYQDVPHGTVHYHDYASKAAGDQRQFAVYTPPGYETDQNKYPLLVLQHGSGDNQATWVVHGKANWIEDNLIAAGKAKPMVILMLNGHVAPANQRGQNVELLQKDLLEQVLPMVEKIYRVESSPAMRGIVGLSMGGGQSLTIGLNNRNVFGWVGGFSSSVPRAETVADQLQNADQANKELHLLWIACGKDDRLVERNREFVDMLKQKGIDHQWYETEGDHSWPVWRRYLGDFLPTLFQN
jgi:enterochelin esterase family protein